MQAGRVIIDDPLGIELTNAVVQNIAVPESGRTPKQKPDDFYKNPSNAESFVTERRNHCPGCFVEPVEAKDRIDRTTRETSKAIIAVDLTCAHCRQTGAHLYCTSCRHWFHGDHRKLPSTDEKLLAIPTGKRNADGSSVFMRICGMQRLVRNMPLLHLLQQPRLPIKLGQIVAEHLLQRMVLHP